MKKYVILTLALIFGIAILSGTMTYVKTNEKEEKNTRNIVENVESVKQEVVNTVNENEKIPDIVTDENNKIQIENQKNEKTPAEDTKTESINSKIFTPQIKENQAQTIAEVKNENNQNNEKDNNTPLQTKEEKIAVQPKQEVKQDKKNDLGEEYKTNDAMINAIKNVINSNQSEDMKIYGYNIVIDSSIVNITSQFTYTEQRVIDKIKYKFGTIKIYVRDYYNNGEFICTQCYII